MPLQVRILVITAALIIGAVLATTLLLTDSTSQTLREQVQVDAQAYVRQYARVLGKAWDTPERQQMLDHIQGELLGEHLYTVWIMDPNGAIMTHSTLPNYQVPEQISRIDAARMQAAMAQKQPLSDMEDDYFWITAPIMAPGSDEVNGAMLGYVPTQRLQDTLNEQIVRAILVAGVVLLVGLGIFGLLIRSLTPPIAQIENAIRAIESESFQAGMLDNVAQRTDILGHLARALQKAGSAVHERTERLQQQMQLLRIEVDAAKKDRDVAEITETDYFRSLQDKAAAMRAKRAAGSDQSG